MWDDDLIYYMFQFLDLKTVMKFRLMNKRCREIVDYLLSRYTQHIPWSIELHNNGDELDMKRYKDGILTIGSRRPYSRKCELCKRKRCDRSVYRGIGLPMYTFSVTCLAKVNLRRNRIEFYPYTPNCGDKAVCDTVVKWERLKRFKVK